MARFVVFKTGSSNLVPGDVNGRSDVFVHDTQTRETARVSINYLHVGGNGFSAGPRITDDGRYITFSSGASNLVITDNNGSIGDIFVAENPLFGDRDLPSIPSLGSWGLIVLSGLMSILALVSLRRRSRRPLASP